ncbi:MAG: hypothetical protein WA885_06140 [Phormidesmis sp.]
MHSLRTNRFVQSLQAVVFGCVSRVQHLLMKAAIAFSLKLCLFTAKVLLNSASADSRQPSRSF